LPISVYEEEVNSSNIRRTRPVVILDEGLEAATIEKLASLTRKLPKENIALLRLLSAHLERVAMFSEENRMSVANLGLIFCPTLGVGSILFGLMLHGWRKLFPNPLNFIQKTPFTKSPSPPPIPPRPQVLQPSDLLLLNSKILANGLVEVECLDGENMECEIGLLNMNPRKPVRNRQRNIRPPPIAPKPPKPFRNSMLCQTPENSRLKSNEELSKRYSRIGKG